MTMPNPRIRRVHRRFQQRRQTRVLHVLPHRLCSITDGWISSLSHRRSASSIEWLEHDDVDLRFPLKKHVIERCSLLVSLNLFNKHNHHRRHCNRHHFGLDQRMLLRDTSRIHLTSLRRSLRFGISIPSFHRCEGHAHDLTARM